MGHIYMLDHDFWVPHQPYLYYALTMISVVLIKVIFRYFIGKRVPNTV